MSTDAPRFASFREFFPYYLGEHQNPICRVLHYVGSWLVLAIAATAIVRGEYRLLWLLPVCGYGFAWVGHFFFEKNRPATFSHPLYSLAGDWVMWAGITLGRIPFRPDGHPQH